MCIRDRFPPAPVAQRGIFPLPDIAALQVSLCQAVPDEVECHSPVSYTHLDVYKRQNLHRSQRSQQAEQHFIQEQEKGAEAAGRMVSVSYTHLDVYKRQE